jgi:hypothetical protein
MLHGSLLLTFKLNNFAITPTDAPTVFHNNLVGIISTTTVGLFAIIVILVTVTIGFSIHHWRRKR